MALRLAGASYKDIADALGYSDPSSAHDVIMQTLSRINFHNAKELRAIENARLDRAQQAIWAQVLDGELGAVKTFLKLAERRAKLNGLDAPQKIQVSDGTKEAVLEMVEDLRALTTLANQPGGDGEPPVPGEVVNE